MEQRKIVIIGKTGNGKSSAGNTLLGKKVFSAKASASSVTAECKKAEGIVHGRKITVIDTPGFFDTNLDDSEIESEIAKALTECAPGIDAFVLVLKVGKYTKHETEVIQQLLNTLDENVLKHTVILFTFGDQLEDQTLEEFMKDNKQLKELVGKCENRGHVIDNKYWNDCHSGDKSNSVQVKSLLDTIDDMVKKNGCYTNELLKYLEKEIQEQMKIVPGTHLPLEAKREKGKRVVHKIILLAGATTGALVGAFLGVAVAIASVLTLLKTFLELQPCIQRTVASATVKVDGGTEAAAGVTTSTGILVGTLGAAAFAGALGGAVTGWEASKEVDSVCDAIKISAVVNYENAKAIVEEVKEFAGSLKKF